MFSKESHPDNSAHEKIPKALPVKHEKISPEAQKISININEIMRRLRILEERYSNLRKKNQLTDQNMLEDTKKLSDTIKVIQSTINELKKEVLEVNSKIKMLSEEVSQSVEKRDFKLLSKYLDFWQPLDFIRKGEAKLIIEDILKEEKNKPKVI
ncbi:hypothetical protein JXB41_04140 [Candidatus Woesearchaeota archaeon]|nr:hypothetical protein [Candidatus Woesearchaeota archaeon]